MSLALQFTIVGAIVTIAAMTVLGLWVADNTRNGMLRSSAFASAILMKSVFSPYVSAIAATGTITPEQKDELDQLYAQTLSDAGLWSIKLWNPQGDIVYLSNEVLIPEEVGPGRIARAAAGEIVVNFEEGYNHPDLRTPFIEIYVPLYADGFSSVTAVGEFHQEASILQSAVAESYARSWMEVGIVGLAMIVTLYAVVLRGSRTIVRQQTALQAAARLSADSARQNEQLRIDSDETRLRAAEVNEQLLGRVGADLHDGPIQVLSVLNFKLTHLLSSKSKGQQDAWKDPALIETRLRNSLDGLIGLASQALEELRGISADLVLPELADLTIDGTIALAVSRHEALTGLAVQYWPASVPPHASHLIKTCIYRVVQEALNNSARYAGGRGQKVTAAADGAEIVLEISDSGPGMGQVRVESEDRRGLGLLGMTNRINAVGGALEITAPPGGGTLIRATIPLAGVETPNWP
ncbi:sensor histidine kinase [Devosia rhizoryzae]|uniref:histidine kinase n=1 Tax=Devosia rhizoryzae TaxID=2774137 RepID=A0ABX7C4T3_9HYPH|nr:ATP-binding protein [Devosia rhizoryzae]QQR39260.1 hypothetical protein JI748_16290 [Devosia rhizoryzae]